MINSSNLCCRNLSEQTCINLSERYRVTYVSINLEDPCAMFKMDLTNLIFKDLTFDLVICSHILKHVNEDLKAIKEIHRVLKKNGTAFFQIPIGYFEDPDGKCTEEFSERRFYGHIRSYGCDFDRRLAKVSFEVDIIHFKNAPSQLGIGKEVIFKYEKYEQGDKQWRILVR